MNIGAGMDLILLYGSDSDEDMEGGASQHTGSQTQNASASFSNNNDASLGEASSSSATSMLIHDVDSATVPNPALGSAHAEGMEGTPTMVSIVTFLSHLIPV